MSNTYDTSSEPLGSTAVKVLFNNASNLDDAVNAFVATWVDRFGNTRRTWNSFETDFTNFLLASGYEFIGDYVTNSPLTITRPNQIFSRSGEYYRPGPALTLPYTTVANWTIDGPKFISVGDAALRQDLANGTDPVKGATMLGTRFGSGPVRTQRDKNYDRKSVSDFASLQAGIQWFVDNSAEGVLFLDADVVLTSKVFFTTGVIIDLNGHSVSPATAGMTLFESAYVSAGTLISNVGTTPQSHAVFRCGVRNGTLKGADIALNTQDTLDQCDFSGLYFENNTADLRGTQIFYPKFERWMSRTTGGNAPFPMLDIAGNANALGFFGMSSVGRQVGWKFTNGSAVAMYSSNAESGLQGVQQAGQLSAYTSVGGYYEDMSSAGMDFSVPVGTYSANIHGNYFNSCAIGIAGAQMFGGRISGNYFVNCPQWVSIPDNFSTIEVEVEDQIAADVGSAFIPVKYTLGRYVKPIGRSVIYDSGSGLPMAASEFIGGINTSKYGGNVGTVPTGKVPFCTVATSPLGASGVSVYVSTAITYQNEADVIYKFKVQDNTEVVTYAGIIMGDTVIAQNTPAGHTVVVGNVGGFLRIELTGHHIPSTYSCTGKVKLIG